MEYLGSFRLSAVKGDITEKEKNIHKLISLSQAWITIDVNFIIFL